MFPAKGFLCALVAALALHFLAKVTLGVSVVTATALFMGLGGWAYCRLCYKLLPRDLALVMLMAKLLKTLKKGRQEKTRLPDFFLEQAKLNATKTALVFEGKKWSFAELDSYACRVANYFGGTVGLKKGDVIALFVENSPEFVGLYLGLAKIGVISALINTHIRKEGLLHCMKVVNVCAVVYSSALEGALLEVLPMMEDSLQSEKTFAVRGNAQSISQSVNLDNELENASDSPPSPVEDPSFFDTLCYIYTSGTTGLPKAAIVTNERAVLLGKGYVLFSNKVPSDIIYCCLPLYHTSGGALALGGLYFNGCTVVLRKKFSASNFWTDCIENRCTIVYYIGEICRYLLAQQPQPTDTQHSVRIAIGNGLRPQIWKQFQSRFNLKQIFEFYGATEGTVGFFNICNKENSVGFVPISLPLPRSSFLLKVDPISGEIIRDKNNFCIRAGIDEPGELIGKIDNFIAKFHGYSNKEANEKKIIRNVFKQGDKYYLTGDMLREDKEGYMYFCDRLGDTFRWKGENVSTAEVESIIATILKLRDVTVYGVAVPGMEGKAGAAAIADPDGSIDLGDFLKSVSVSLPKYAIPIFVRLVNKVELTGTFKLQKTRLKKEGIDLEVVKDPLFILDPREKAYVRYDEVKQQELVSGLIKI